MTGTGGSGACGSGQMTCNGSCTDVQTDGQNCGTWRLRLRHGDGLPGRRLRLRDGLRLLQRAVRPVERRSLRDELRGLSGERCLQRRPVRVVVPVGEHDVQQRPHLQLEQALHPGHCGDRYCCIRLRARTGATCTNGTCVGGGSTGGTTGTGGAGSGGTTGTGGTGTGGTGTAGTGGATHTGGTTGTGGAGSGGTAGTGGSGTGGSGTTNQPVLVTSTNGAYWKTNGTLTTVTSGTATVTVNDTSPLQTWEGFGGAFNEVGWNVISMLSASDQAKAIDYLFGSDAAHFAVGRIPIGASDYALQRYTDDETSGDTNLASFSITEDMKYLIPYIKAAQGANPSLKFWASPWTPPTWMKTTSGSVNGTSCALVGSTKFDGGCMTAGTNNQNLTTYANYFVKWVAAYAAQQIPVGIVSAQNEPN